MSDDVKVDIEALRRELLEKSQQTFGSLFDSIDRLQRYAETHPDDTEIAWLAALIRQSAKDALNAVTCKVIVNGAAVDDARKDPEGEHGQ